MNTHIHPIHEVWAQANGVDDSTAAIIMASIISSLSGPNTRLMGFAGPSSVPLAQLVFADDDGRANDLVDKLLDPARIIQSKLKQRFDRLDTELIKEVLVGAKGALSYRKAIDDHEQAILGRGVYPIPKHEDVFTPDGDIYDQDLDNEGLIQRLELVLRPGFLIESPTVGTLPKTVQSLHLASGLLWGGSGLCLDGLKREAIGTLHSLLNGGRTLKPELLSGGRKGETEPCKVSSMLNANLESLGSPELRPLIRDSLIIKAPSVSATALPSSENLGSAYHTWRRLIQSLLNCRRKALRWDHGARETDMNEFEERYREYRNQCRESLIPSRTVRDLPRILACLPLEKTEDDIVRMSAEECFKHAEILRLRHEQLWHRVKGQDQVNTTVNLAKRLLEKIRDRQPMSQRDIVRSFDKQRAELYVPTLELMTKAGLIIETQAKLYSLGPINDVEKALKPLLETHHLRIVA